MFAALPSPRCRLGADTFDTRPSAAAYPLTDRPAGAAAAGSNGSSHGHAPPVRPDLFFCSADIGWVTGHRCGAADAPLTMTAAACGAIWAPPPLPPLIPPPPAQLHRVRPPPQRHAHAAVRGHANAPRP